nr:unnamed protein product [Digitaria exilis]
MASRLFTPGRPRSEAWATRPSLDTNTPSPSRTATLELLRPIDAGDVWAVVEEAQHVVVVEVEAEVARDQPVFLGQWLRRDQRVRRPVEALPQGSRRRVRDDEVAGFEEGYGHAAAAARLALPYRGAIGVGEGQVTVAAKRDPGAPAVHGRAGVGRPDWGLVGSTEKEKAFSPASRKPQEKVVSVDTRKGREWSSTEREEPGASCAGGPDDADEQDSKRG